MPEEAVKIALEKIRAACDELEAAYGAEEGADNEGGMPDAMPGGMAPETPASPLMPGAFDTRRF